MILDLMIWSPIILGILILIFGDKSVSTSYWLSVISSVMIFALSLYALSIFDTSLPDIQFELTTTWIERFNINYHLGVDGISFPLILLTTFITPIVLFTSKTTDKVNIHPVSYTHLTLPTNREV